MTRTQELLFALLRCELWSKEFPTFEASLEDYEAVFELARRHAIIGVVGNAFIRHNVELPTQTVMRLFAEHLQIQQQNAHMNAEMEKFVDFMRRHNLSFVVVKGQIVAQDYPRPHLRQSGDIDFYCDSRNFGKATKILGEMLGRDLTPHVSAKHVEFEIDGIEYELHSMLSEFASRRHQNYFNRLVEEQVNTETATVRIGNTEVPTLSPTMNALYLFVHIFFHLMTSGVGLRQITDLTMFLHQHCEEVSAEELQTYLDNLSLAKAFRAVGSILITHLGLSEDKFPFPLTRQDHRRGRKMLRNILRMGNFGLSARKTHTPGILHSLESGMISLRQCAAFFPLAPREALCRIPQLTLWFLKKNTGHTA